MRFFEKLARPLPFAKVRVITGSVIEALCMIRILLHREAGNLEPALIVFSVLLFLIIQTICMQLFRKEFVGRFRKRLVVPYQLGGMLTRVSYHLLQRRQLIVEIAGLW